MSIDSPPQLGPPPPLVTTSEAQSPKPSSALPSAPPGASSTTGGHILVLDAWRGAAVAALLIGHFVPAPKINLGRLGVELFFILSGFLMGRLLFVKQTPLGLFYKRRISRIFPAAYVFLAIIVLAGSLGWTAERPVPAGVASTFLFYVNYYIALGLASGSPAPLGFPGDHFWSLCVEEHTYVYLSILAVVHRRTGLRATGLLIASFLFCFMRAAYVGALSDGDYYQVYWRSDCRAGSILCGAVAACLASRGFGSRSSYMWVRADVLGVGFALLGVLLNFSKFPDMVKYSLGAISLGLGLLLVSRHVDGGSRLLRPLVWLGAVSYSLYLWQQPFYVMMRSGTLFKGQALGLALIVGLASYFLVERPIRLYLNATWARSPRSAT